MIDLLPREKLPQDRTFEIGVIYLVWFYILVRTPFWVSWPFVLWMALGLLTVALRIGSLKPTRIAREIMFGFRIGMEGIPMTVLLGPIELLITLVRGRTSYELDFLESVARQKKSAPYAFNMHWHTAREMAEEKAREVRSQSKSVETALIVTPLVLRNGAKTGLFATSLSGLSALAEPPPIEGHVQTWQPDGELSFTAYDHYLAMSSSKAFTKTPVMWTTLRLNLPSGMWVESFGSFGTSQAFSQRFSYESDLALGKNWTIGNWKLVGAARLMDMYPVSAWDEGDVVKLSLNLSRTYTISSSHSLKPEFIAEWMANYGKWRDGAEFLRMGLTHTWNSPLDIKPLKLVHTEGFAWDSGWRGNNPETVFFQSTAGLNWQISKKIQLTLPGVRATVPLSDGHDGRKADKAVYTGLSIKF